MKNILLLIILTTSVCCIELAYGRIQDTCRRLPRNKRNAAHWEKSYNMTVNIEGGLYTETYRSDEILTNLHERYGPGAERTVSTHIYYMLRENEFSAFHQLDSDEMWHWYYGDTLALYVIDHVTGELRIDYLGPNCGKFVSMVKAGNWYAAKLKNPKPNHYALLGITVAPGFEFVDFRFAKTEELVASYPQHVDIIREMAKAEE